MKLSKIISDANVALSKTMFKCKKRSPEILLVSGIAGLVTAGILACKATTKAHLVAEKTSHDLQEMEEAIETNPEDYTEEDKKKTTITIYSQMTWGYVKLYAPSVILASLSVASILTSHNIMRKRNMQLATALAGVTEAFEQYRSRVREKYGDDADKALRYNTDKVELIEAITDENGKIKKKKEKVDVFDETSLGLFAKVFDASCNNWQPDNNYNLNFLKLVEYQMTDRLRRYGHVFLNEVYDIIGIERTDIGQFAGWVYDPDSDISDNYIDLGLYNGRRIDEYGEINQAIIIDPNCDGSIIDRVFRKGGK